MPRYFFSSLLLLLLVFTSYSQTDLNRPVPVDSAVLIGKLPNGLTYYIRQNKKPEKKLELRLVVNAGSILEEDNQQGLAHFMEHMGFNGSKNFPKNELVDYLQKTGVKFGADLNAYTSFDETVYILPIPADDPVTVKKGFTVLEDWAFNNLMDRNEIEKERGVVLEELRLSKGAQERMMRKYLPLLLNHSLYARRLPIGTDTVLKNFTPEVLESFYKQWYRPNLMAVIVVGDIDPRMAQAFIVEHFGKAANPANEKPRVAMVPIAERNTPDAIVLTDEEETSTTIQILNYIRPWKPVNTLADYRKEVLNNLATTLLSQRLQEKTQEANPPFVFAFTGLSPFVRGYQASMSVAVAGDNPPAEAINALIGETEKARKFGFLPAEIERGRSILLKQAEQSFLEKDKLESRVIAQRYISHFLQQSPIPGERDVYQFMKEIVPGISDQEVNEYVKQLPSTQNAVTIVTAPEAIRDKLPTSQQLMDIVKAAGEKQVTAYEEKEVRTNLIDKKITAGKVLKKETNAKLGTTTYTLSNNVTVTIKPTQFKNDQVLMDAWRWGGYHKVPVADKSNAQYAAQMVGEMGVKDMSPTELKKFLSGKTVKVSPYINAHEEGIDGSSSVKDFETFLQLIHLYVTEPRKNADLFNSAIKKESSMMKFLKADPMTFFQDTLSKVVYKNSPWADRLPDEKFYNSLNLDKSFAFYQKTFGNLHGMHFTFVGNLDEKTAIPLIEKYLGSLPSKPMPVTFKDNNLRPVRGKVNLEIKKGKEQQSMLALHFEGNATFETKELLSFRALVEILNIQVIEKLREDMSGMYGGGFYGSIEKRPYPHYTLEASIPCGPENVEKLTTALFDIIRTARTNIQEKDLQKVKTTLIKAYETGIQTNEYWLSTLSNSWINRRDPNLALAYKKNVEAITVEDVKRAAQKYLDLNNYVKAVLYPEKPKEEKKTF